MRSDAYVLHDDAAQLEPAPARVGAPPPVVDLDPRFYKRLADFEARFPAGPPSLVRAERLVVRGDVTFGAGSAVVGRGRGAARERRAAWSPSRPGRVNLIGEHTDYNDGLSLPFAIEQGVRVTAVAASRRRAARARAGSSASKRGSRCRAIRRGGTGGLDRLRARHRWRELGAARLRAARRASLRSRATCREGRGLSSSAALEVALCLALLGLAERRRAARPGRARAAVLARRERLGRRPHGAARPARVAARHAASMRCGSTFARSRSRPVPLLLGAAGDS